MARQAKSKQKGFSVIEVIIALFIFAVVLLIYSAATNTVVLNRTAKNKQLAFRIADTEMEKLRYTAYGSLPASGNISDSLLSSLPSGAESITVSNYNTKAKRIDVNVTWQDPGNVSRTVTLTTIRTQGGIGQ